MSFIQKIQNKPREKKIRIIWLVIIAVTVLLLALWVSTSRIGKTRDPDTTLFKTIGDGIKNIKDSY